MVVCLSGLCVVLCAQILGRIEEQGKECFWRGFLYLYMGATRRLARWLRLFRQLGQLSLAYPTPRTGLDREKLTGWMCQDCHDSLGP